MSWTDDLLEGLAGFVAQLGAGTWDPTGTSGSIIVGALPDEIDQGIGLQDYSTQADPAMADVVQPVQFWIRGDDAYVKATADLLFDGMHGAVGQTIGGIRCPLIVLYSDLPMGVDQKGRRERAVNYYVTASRPTAWRPD